VYTTAVNTIAFRVYPLNRLRKRLAVSRSRSSPGCSPGSDEPLAAVHVADSVKPCLRYHVTIATTNR
jgi:hypothetical protein